MSVTAALLSFGFWKSMEKSVGTSEWGLYENNINQTTASSAASIVSAGFAAPIPALALLTGQMLSWPLLVIWTLSVSLVGVFLAASLRYQFLLKERLNFPSGIATAETVKQVYSKTSEGGRRLKLLMVSLLGASGFKCFDQFIWSIPQIPFLPSLFRNTSMKSLGFVLDPSLLMLGFGAIIGIRAGISLLIGAVICWAILAPWILHRGYIEVQEANASFLFGDLVEWTLWPGITMMLVSSLTALWFSMRKSLSKNKEVASDTVATKDLQMIPRRFIVIGMVLALLLAVATQSVLFAIPIWTGGIAVLLTYILATVSARISGETGITPLGAMGKVTQLTFGALLPGHAAGNLMPANVTGGACDQCADLLHDFKTGLLIGASPVHQMIAQLFGVAIGALVGSATYLILIPDPQSMLITAEWPAPAVATWKAVAELLMDGFGNLPEGCLIAMLIAGCVGFLLATLEGVLGREKGRFLPSAGSMGLAFVIPAWNSISMFLGALIAFLIIHWAGRHWTRMVIVVAAGLVAGESLAGVIGSIVGMSR